jgi:hypothetical protein
MMTLAIRAVTANDLPIPTEMNTQLIEDEQSRNPMSLDALAERMHGWLHSDWCVDVITVDSPPCGFEPYCTTMHLKRIEDTP